MTPSDIAHHLERLKIRAAELEQSLADPGIYQRAAELDSRRDQVEARLMELYEELEEA